MPTFLNKIPFIDKLLFTKHLSVMIKAGIPLPDSLVTLRDQTKNESFKKVLTKVNSDVSNGQELGKSLGKFPQVFDSLYRSVVTLGEESGTLETNLEYLALELSKSYEFKKKVRSAMFYPAIVMTLIIVVGGGISIFVLPQLSELFSSLNTELPLSTRILLAISNVMKNWGIPIMTALIGSIFALAFAVRLPTIKPIFDRIVIRMPIFGSFLQNVEIASFCRNFGMMLKSGLHITTALGACRDAAENDVFKQYLGWMLDAVEKGKSLEEELSAKKYQFIPPILTRMIGVGEKTGKLDESLLYLGDFFSEEVDEFTKNLPTIIEPIMLIIVAILVAFLAMAIISPIYQFTTSVHR